MFGLRRIKEENKKLKEIIKETEELVNLIKEDKTKVIDNLSEDMKKALKKVNQMQNNYNILQEEMYKVEDENRELKFELEQIKCNTRVIQTIDGITLEVSKEKVTKKPRKKKEVVKNEEKI